jgi:signal transduction histidine kinase
MIPDPPRHLGASGDRAEGGPGPGTVGRQMLDFAREVVSTLDVERVLQRVLEMARDMTDAEYAALGVLDERREHLERFLTLGIDDERRRRIGPLPRGHGVLGELIRDPRPLRLDDVGSHPRSYGFPIGHPRMASFLGVPILIDGVAFGNLYLCEKRSGRFDDADEDAVVTLAGWAAVAIANARVHESVAQRRDELEQSVAGLSAMMDIALALGGETHADAMLELVVKRARALVSANAMVVALNDGSHVAIAAVAGAFSDERRGERITGARGAVHEALRTRRAVHVDGDSVRRLLHDHDTTPGALAGLVVPLVFRDRVLGVLLAVDRLVDGPRFTRRDEELLQAFSTTAAAALATAHSVAAEFSQLRLAAEEAERNRWARELHDETLQALAMLRMTLSAARRRGDADGLMAAVADALEHIDGQITSLRGLIAELRPTALDDLGLEAALEALSERAASMGGAVELEVDLDYEAGRSDRRHLPALEATVYRIAQEGITNAIKHAGGGAVRVRLRDVGDDIELRIEDDGRGFDPEAATSGFGLLGMRERAELLGGSLEVASTPGDGTVIVARLPGTRRATAAPRGIASS